MHEEALTTMPQETPGRRSSVSFEEFAELAVPVPDLASTLTSRAEDQANEENVSFLRSTAAMSEVEEEDSVNLQAYRRLRQMDTLINEHRRQTERESARRLRRAVLRSGMPPPPAEQHGQDNENTQSVQNASRDTLRRTSGYQGWAPGTLDNDLDETHLTFDELRALARGHSWTSHETATRRHIREEELGSSGNTYGRRTVPDPDELDWQTNRLMDHSQGLGHQSSESSLQRTALLQSVRRHTRFSPRSWLLNGGSDRDRAASGATRERDRGTESPRLFRANVPQRRDPIDDLRRGMSYDLHRARSRDEQGVPTSHYLVEAIKYLDRLRYGGSDSERLSFAEEGGFVDGDVFHYSHDREDFILDTASIPPPQQSSWLRAGSVFSGCQQSHTSSLPSFHMISSSSRPNQPSSNPRSRRDQTPASSTPSSRSWLHSSSRMGENNDDTWPVKVTINSIDHATMTLTGTMEAFNVPNKNHPYQETTIATYLEGEIIDFNRFTLETKNFEATLEKDSTYWRELEPFKSLKDQDLVPSVVSKKWLSEELGERYILMRWKGKLIRF